MRNSIFLAVLTGMFGFLEIRSLTRRKLKKEAVVIGILFVLGMGLGIAMFQGIPIPSPFQALKLIYRPVSSWFFQPSH